jgi:ATP-dependent RNA helicase DOB1
MREVSWVIFDEGTRRPSPVFLFFLGSSSDSCASLHAALRSLHAVHYMRDRERGVVWEESIILLPPAINQVFLSATLTTEDSQQFCDWVCRLKSRPCHVVSTNYRPTPLCHYLFPAGGEGLYLAVDEKGQFKSENVNQARQALVTGIERSRRGYGGGGGGSGSNDLVRLVQLMMAKSWLPIIVFSFSRRECEGRALQVSKLDLTTDQEKKLVLCRW